MIYVLNLFRLLLFGSLFCRSRYGFVGDVSAGIDWKVKIGKGKRTFYFDLRDLYFNRLCDIYFSHSFLSGDLFWFNHGKDSILIDCAKGRVNSLHIRWLNSITFLIFNWLVQIDDFTTMLFNFGNWLLLCFSFLLMFLLFYFLSNWIYRMGLLSLFPPLRGTDWSGFDNR